MLILIAKNQEVQDKNRINILDFLVKIRNLKGLE